MSDPDALPLDPAETGRWLVGLGRRPVGEGVRALRALGVADVATSSDRAVGPVPALLLEHLGVAVVDAPLEGPLGAAGAGPVPPGAVLERERWVRLPPDPRDVEVATVPSGDPTWGLRALGLDPRRGRDGAGVAVCVLDTGADLRHPDLRVAGSTSLVPGEDAQDVQGHGTHCAGTVAGAPGYAVAPGALLHVAKVLDRDGRGREADVLAGVEWAVEQGCRVMSMSLSSPGGGPPSRVFELVARELLDEGVVMVAASGNDSSRPGQVAPVGRPASCPSVLAVGALAPDLSVAAFSNGGPELDVAAPGVDVDSAWPGGGRRRLSGTSMATPHVAGVVALLLEAAPGLSAREVVQRLRAQCRPVAGGAEAVGEGLVQAP